MCSEPIPLFGLPTFVLMALAESGVNDIYWEKGVRTEQRENL